MFAVHGNFHEAEITTRASRHGSVFITIERQSEDLLQADKNDFGHSNVEYSDMINKPNSTVNITTDNTTCKNGNTRSSKCKVPTLEKKELEIDGLEIQCSFLIQGYPTAPFRHDIS
ncbi:hypothetical protein AYI68_g3578 [Smittium mucronatum]|uniref:Uncharacterized protein n=1 Tax=Smittium mucronatum TaxID=133383 RepID=A0A1R0GZH3_9FUNG|nr:hypothetical protein AYI68_g3578 [Smittium mucronatum]